MNMTSRAPQFDEDPPLDEAGELRLSRDLQQLADALRGEAARLGEQAVPQVAAGNLRRRLAERPGMAAIPARRVSPWGWAFGGVALTVVTMLLVVTQGRFAGWNTFEEGSQGGRAVSDLPQVDGHAEPMVATGAPVQEAEPLRTSAPPWPLDRNGASDATGTLVRRGEIPSSPYPTLGGVDPFLAQRPESTVGFDESQGAWLGDPRRLRSELLTSSEDKMWLLEQALDRYRSVIEFQQEQIRQDQEDLEAARAEIERLEQQLREAGIRMPDDSD
jgi:hypothetical protein